MTALKKRINELERRAKPELLPKVAYHKFDGSIQFDGKTFSNLAEYKAYKSGITAYIFDVKIVNEMSAIS